MSSQSRYGQSYLDIAHLYQIFPVCLNSPIVMSSHSVQSNPFKSFGDKFNFDVSSNAAIRLLIWGSCFLLAAGFFKKLMMSGNIERGEIPNSDSCEYTLSQKY